jgi:hypothetical protein
MLAAGLSRIAFELPPEERLELACRLVESVVAPVPLNEAVTEGVRRLEDTATGRVEGLTNAFFYATHSPLMFARAVLVSAERTPWPHSAAATAMKVR